MVPASRLPKTPTGRRSESSTAWATMMVRMAQPAAVAPANVECSR